MFIADVVSQEVLEETIKELKVQCKLKGTSPAIYGAVTDVTDPRAVAQSFADCVTQFGGHVSFCQIRKCSFCWLT